MTALELVRLTKLMELTSGSAEVVIGLLDGPLAVDHPELAVENIRTAPGGIRGACRDPRSIACSHGTFVAGILSARRGSPAPALCPGCTLLVRPVFDEDSTGGGRVPVAAPEELAGAILESVDAGARVLNLSAGFGQPSSRRDRALEEALNQAARRGVLVVAAAGNQGTIGSSTITRHPAVIPVVACDLRGRPIGQSNLSGTIGRRGLGAPGEDITSLGPTGGSYASAGTSVAAPFVSGALALLWSLFRAATPADLRRAVLGASPRRGTTVVPPLLDAWRAYQVLALGSQ